MKSIAALILVGFVVSGCAYDDGYYRHASMPEQRRDDRDHRSEERQPVREPVRQQEREYQRDRDTSQRQEKVDDRRGGVDQRRDSGEHEHEQRREQRD